MFWAFVGWRTKSNRASLRNEVGVSVTSMKGKLKKHYKQLGRMSVDRDFDFEWKEAVERKVSMCSSLSEVCEDEVLDRRIEREETEKRT